MSGPYRLLNAALAFIADRPADRAALSYALGKPQSRLNALVARWLRSGYMVEVGGMLATGQRPVRLTPAECTRRMRAKRRAAGLCVSCKNPHVGSDRCGPCMRVERERASARYAKKIEAGARRPRGCTQNCAPVAAFLLEHGPATIAEIFDRFPAAASTTPRPNRNVYRWARTGWLTKLPGGRFDAGPLAHPGAWVKSALAEPPRVAVDQTADEGSDQWLLLAQLEHGPLDLDAVVDVLDSGKHHARRVLSDLVQLGRAVEVDGEWSLIQLHREAAE